MKRLGWVLAYFWILGLAVTMAMVYAIKERITR
jgi:hypothetical protein